MTHFLKVFFAIVVVLTSTGMAYADVELIPESRHQLNTSFGLFFEDQNVLVMRNAGRAWGAFGISGALVELKDVAMEPQLLVLGSANASYRISSLLQTETVDARVGLQIELTLEPETRLAVGWTHQSGHIADDIQDLRMVGPNLGNEIIHARITHDLGQWMRFGGTLRPFVGSEPPMKTFGADQFVEIMPWGQASSRGRLTPYLGLGLEEYGVNQVVLTRHVQLGAYLGNHFSREHHQMVRVALGYYCGIDPRMKFAQFMLSRNEFGYLGLMLDI